MSITDAREFIDVEPVVPVVGGVLAAATVIPATGHSLLGAEYLTDACANGGEFAELCQVDPTIADCSGSGPAPETVFKHLDEQPSLVQGSPFAVYAGVECESDMQTNLERAERRLRYVEGRHVDYHVIAMLDAEGSAMIAESSLLELVAQADNILGAFYGGYGTILVSRREAVIGYADDAFDRAGDGSLVTVNGTHVANVAEPLPAGYNHDLYVTGRIVLVQGPVISRVVPAVTLPDGTCAPQRAIAERLYVPMYECFAYYGDVTP